MKLKTSKAFARIDLQKLFANIMKNKGLQTFIGDLQRDRLEFTGKDIDGNRIQTDEAKLGNTRQGAYAKTTEFLKDAGLTIRNGKRVRSKTRPTDIVTLKQEGEFHKTIVGELKGYIMTVKKDWTSPGDDIRKNFELSDTDRFFGFTDQDISEIIGYILKNGILNNELKKMMRL